jgi:hypothetical protein
MTGRYDANGPYVTWIDNGCEGWAPRSFDTLREAVIAETYGSDVVVTKVVQFETEERKHGAQGRDETQAADDQ